MLQIASGMYFETSDFYETVHRRTLYTNVGRMRADDVVLPVGTVRFSSGSEPVQALTIEVTDRLEKTDSNGQPSIHVATSGDELIEDAADIIAFGLDAIVLSNQDQARRLISGETSGRVTRKLLNRALEPARYVTDEELEDLRQFSGELLGLRRPQFEAAMRAIRRIADAVSLTGSDVTLAYTLFVAALESLSKGAVVEPIAWESYEKPKRQLVDAATSGLSEKERTSIQTAVLEIDALSIRRRFQAFVLDHVEADFYRDGASQSTRPVRAVDLPKTLDFAYQIRSQSMHDLRDLAPELWRVGDDADTSWHQDRTVLTLEGLHRLCHHVLRNYVARSLRGVDAAFKKTYRDAIPGIVQVRWAAQYWVGVQDSFDAKLGPTIFSALVEMVPGALAGVANSMTDMSAPAGRIEVLLPAQAKAAARLPLFATYWLWHLLAPPELRRPNAEGLFKTYGDLLGPPSVYAYVVGLLTSRTPPWLDSDIDALADERERDLLRAGRSLLELPARVDAIIQIDAGRRAWIRGDARTAAVRLAKAVELLPGNARFIELEAGIAAGALDELTLTDLLWDPEIVSPSAD